MVKKRKSKKQAVIAEEVSQQQQHIKLKRQIATLKRLPKDFRDITLGTDWEAFADITGRRKEMDDWWNGPVLYLTLLNESEKAILGSPNKLVRVNDLWLGTDEETGLTPENWIDIIQTAEAHEYSWIYLPVEPLPVITALNVLLSRFGYNVRAKGQLISEYSGKPVGVVH